VDVGNYSRRFPPPWSVEGGGGRVLKEHHQIAEEIMDVRDWAMED